MLSTSMCHTHLAENANYTCFLQLRAFVTQQFIQNFNSGLCHVHFISLMLLISRQRINGYMRHLVKDIYTKHMTGHDDLLGVHIIS